LPAKLIRRAPSRWRLITGVAVWDASTLCNDLICSGNGGAFLFWVEPSVAMVRSPLPTRPTSWGAQQLIRLVHERDDAAEILAEPAVPDDEGADYSGDPRYCDTELHRFLPGHVAVRVQDEDSHVATLPGIATLDSESDILKLPNI
jgi:hypothetical protein